jgi:voltage-gated sodium channel
MNDTLDRKLNKLSAIVILFSALMIGIEATFHAKITLQNLFNFIDVIIVLFFSFEIVYRIKKVEYSFKNFINVILAKFKLTKALEGEKSSEILEEWFWILFDLSLVLLSFISFFRHFFDHPQLLLILRMFRIFRIFRVFELNDSLKSIEKKIISVVPTIVTFFVLIILLLYTYSIVGMYLYNFKTFETIDFSSVYQTMTSLFVLMTNGWSDTLIELRKVNEVATLVTDIYIISFFLFSVIVTLNVFLAVMTSQIQEKLAEDIESIKQVDETIKSEILQMEKESDKENRIMMDKLNLILKEIEILKRK